MKRILITVLVLTTFGITAQERKRENKRSEGQEKMQMMKDLTPQEAATLKTKKMTLHLNMSEAQQKEIYALNLKTAERHQVRQAERAQRKEDDKSEKPSKEERLKLINEKLDLQIAHKKEMQRILDKDQFEKWERSNQHKGKRRDGKQKNKKHRSKRSR